MLVNNINVLLQSDKSSTGCSNITYINMLPNSGTKFIEIKNSKCKTCIIVHVTT